MNGRAVPSMKAREVIRALEQAGFVVVRSSGSHHRLVHRADPTGQTTVPVHQGRDLAHGTLRSIIRQAGFTIDEFIALL